MKKTIIGVLNQTNNVENRVTITPKICKKLKEISLECFVETGAGKKIHCWDDLYQQSGGKIVHERDVLSQSDIIFLLSPLKIDQIEQLKEGSWLVGLLSPFGVYHHEHPTSENSYGYLFDRYIKKKINTLSLELLPRISRVQYMDILSSQSGLRGYRSVIEAAYYLDRSLPMMITAAGTIQPAKVLVIGAGIAGLQAIATAKRLGADVRAYDPNPQTKEEAQTLGATWIDDITFLPNESQKKKESQQKSLYHYFKDQDIIIMGAQNIGQKAPVLMTSDMVAQLNPGTVVVDLSMGLGGNCEESVLDEIKKTNNVTVIGYGEIARGVGYDASHLMANNFYNFLRYSLKKEEKSGSMVINVNFDDEVFSKTILTYQGSIIHPDFQLINNL
jgi:NAD(P) transhydrogenase subunit alpha